MIHNRDNLTQTVQNADAEGLSYGQYVAREIAKHVLRKPIPKDYLSINDRKRLGIETPIYCGTTTIEAGLIYDCPQMVDNLIKWHKRRKEMGNNDDNRKTRKKVCVNQGAVKIDGTGV